ncbi:Phosphorylated adapter RNA export protein [Tupaia chinensis]|uniref:Phosphorylated adapter RNA export protein n=1 Tax=Tupaia chinensis TaxID=246437 RepID=L9LDN6_TUPCH|nr:Phosphorylated adapter RNA export protein [Tupaia chinensis]
MEDGQLSYSNSDMTVAPSDRPLQVPKVLSGDSAVRAFQSTTPACTPVSHYRTVKSVDSSEESASDSDDDSSLWKRKRQKCFNPPPKPEPFQFGQCSQKAPAAGGKKINNIWGAVLQEQNQEAVATELGRGKWQGHLKRKPPVKDRLGDRLEMNYKGRYETTEQDSQEKVADEISSRLQEPKKDLTDRVVRIIGNKKAIELLMETAKVEQNGSLFIMNGSRRRTPGGVFLNLLKNTPSISEEQIKGIFYIENQKEYEN